VFYNCNIGAGAKGEAGFVQICRLFSGSYEYCGTRGLCQSRGYHHTTRKLVM